MNLFKNKKLKIIHLNHAKVKDIAKKINKPVGKVKVLSLLISVQ
jgi:hypothetical protein